MDTPTIAAYYRESDPMKRKQLLDQSIAAGEEPEENQIRQELWEARYHEKGENGTLADGFLKLWMEKNFRIFHKEQGGKPVFLFHISFQKG